MKLNRVNSINIDAKVVIVSKRGGFVIMTGIAWMVQMRIQPCVVSKSQNMLLFLQFTHDKKICSHTLNVFAEKINQFGCRDADGFTCANGECIQVIC